MKTNRRLTLIGIMMVTAQVLITVMVVQWLIMQYRKEQKLLSVNISRAWEEANRQMLDSMLMERYINPALDTAVKPHLSLKFDHFKRLPVDEGSRKIIVKISDSVKDSVTMRTESIEAKEIFLRGVKLFVNVQEGDSGKGIAHAMEMEMPDTSVLKEAFENRLLLIDPDIRVSWDTTRLSVDDTVSKVKYSYSIQVNDNGIHADIKGSQQLLLMEMLPGGLFGLLLIALTSAAFIISYRSLKAQMLLNAQRNDFIRNMSHELRTPVSTVKVALEALSNFDRSSERDVMQEYLHMAIAETGRLEMLISRVTDLMTAGDLRLNPYQVDIRHILSEVTNSLKPRIEAENATLNLIHNDDFPLVAEVDTLHFKGVLINLIDNSLKYSDPLAQIEIETGLSDNQIIIKVSDRGHGIPSEFAGRIFDKFFRVPQGDLHNIKGYGLGLSYAHMVMKQHGGTISYKPREGGGSVFVLRLKVKG